MYKYLIISIAVMFTFSFGYYLNKLGGIDLLYNASTNDKRQNFESLSRETVSGLYVCDKTSGCNDKHILILKDDLTVEMLIVAHYSSSPENEESETPLNQEDAMEGEIVPQNELKREETTPLIDNQSVPSFSSTTPEETSSGTTSDITTVENPQTVIKEEESPINTSETISENEADEARETKPDLSSLLSSIQEKNPDSILEKGEWDTDVQNMVVITIKSQGTTTLELPRKIVIKSVYDKSLSNINFPKNIYPSMKNPIFFKKNTR